VVRVQQDALLLPVVMLINRVQKKTFLEKAQLIGVSDFFI